jgi:Ti-type conjugative transfer relaxase TraA
MAIAFARLEPVKRSSGQNVCCKAAYNSRDKIQFEGHKFSEEKKFDFSWKPQPVFHSVLLPHGASEKFNNIEYLWNKAEKFEDRKNSQTAMEIVAALPDDKQVSYNDRSALICSFIEKQFVSKGIIAQIDIHQPDIKEQINPETKEKESLDHNWHAHVLLTTRRLNDKGDDFSSHKARDIMPTVRNGRVLFGDQEGKNWGKLWREHQNEYFKEKGIDVQVDFNGVIAQEHLGPVRMRARAFDLFENHETRVSLNLEQVKNPEKVLETITEQQSCFTCGDVKGFLGKFLDASEVKINLDKFWSQEGIVPLLSKETGEQTGVFTTREVIEEEKQILRISEKISHKESFALKTHQEVESLTEEQRSAYDKITNGKRISFVDGFAGTGKSYLLSSLKESYESNGYKVRGFGPDNATSDVLKEKGFEGSENIYKFLFSEKYGYRDIKKGKEVWVIDEASKLSNKPLLEVLKKAHKHDIQVVFSGCTSQFSAVNRGGMFKELNDRFDSNTLKDIQRQSSQKDRDISKDLAKGRIVEAISSLDENGKVYWCKDKSDSMVSLIEKWDKDQGRDSTESYLLLAFENREVKTLNEMVRSIRLERGEISKEEFLCEGKEGKAYVSKGDILEFKENSKEAGILNGMRGELIEASLNKFTVSVDKNEKESKIISFNPNEYSSFQLGYASTKFRAQGKTVDRTYVLSSNYMSEESVYVSLTRHVKETSFFVSSEEYSSVKDFSRISSNEKESTLDFTSKEEIEGERKSAERNEHLETLKSSSSFVDRGQGALLGLWGSISGKGKTVIENFKDKLSDEKFYEIQEPEKVSSSISVVEKNNIEKEINSSSCYQTLLSGPTSLFNSENIKADFKKTIVITQGKESANAFNENYAGKEYVAVSWEKQGDSLGKYDWTELAGRKVVIWPERNQEGVESASEVCSNLKKVGCKSLKLVNLSSGKKTLPEGWALNDKIPGNLRDDYVLTKIQTAPEKGIDPVQATFNLRIKGIDVSEKSVEDVSRIQEVLSRVDERMRPDLEVEHGTNLTKVNNEIISEIAKILKEDKLLGGESQSLIQGTEGIKPEASYQITLLEASRGESLSGQEKEKVQTFVESAKEELNDKGAYSEAGLSIMLERGDHLKELSQADFSQSEELSSSYQKLQDNRNEVFEQEQTLANEKVISKGKGLEL